MADSDLLDDDTLQIAGVQEAEEAEETPAPPAPPVPLLDDTAAGTMAETGDAG